MVQAAIYNGYTADAAELIPRFEALSTQDVLAPVMDLLRPSDRSILEIGAGTGRDAAWLAGRGYHVLAVEPVGALRQAGQSLHAHPRVEWLADELPLLRRTSARRECFDAILSVAVWQHLPPKQHAAAIGTIAYLLMSEGRAIISLRHGPGAPNRRCYRADTDALVLYAAAAGLGLVARRSAGSVQKRNREAGVTWEWLCFDRSR